MSDSDLNPDALLSTYSFWITLLFLYACGAIGLVKLRIKVLWRLQHPPESRIDFLPAFLPIPLIIAHFAAFAVMPHHKLAAHDPTLLEISLILSQALMASGLSSNIVRITLTLGFMLGMRHLSYFIQFPR